MMSKSVFVIYKDGQPLESHIAGLKRNAFEKIGSAKSNVTAMINNHLNYTLKLSKIYNFDKWKEEYVKEVTRYEVVEYVPKEEKYR
jgi:hypothetical protein